MLFVRKVTQTLSMLLILIGISVNTCTAANPLVHVYDKKGKVIEDDGRALRYVYDSELTQEAKNKLAQGFLLRLDIWLESYLKLFAKNHKPKPLLPSDQFAAKYEMEIKSVLTDEMMTVSKKQRQNNRHIIYLHGGAYVLAKEGFQKFEKDIEFMLKHLGDRVTFLDYTGTPHAKYKQLVNTAKETVKILSEKYPNDEFIFFGNSAGSNLALLTSQALQAENHPKRPRKHILLSPWAEISVDNPEMPDYEFYDFGLNIKAIKYAADQFRDGLDYTDPKVSPYYGNFEGIGDIAIFVGTYDLVYPNSVRLYEKAKQNGVRVHHYQYNKMWHDFMVLKPAPEAEYAWKQAADFVK